jgi:hypothetical protein
MRVATIDWLPVSDHDPRVTMRKLLTVASRL